MALEALKDVKEIGGFEVKEVNWNQPKGNYIEVNHLSNAITFKIQNGAVKENGINGCQVDTMIETARIIISKLNEKFPCDENIKAISCLDDALFQLAMRKKDRISRNVEGLEKI